MKSLLLVLLISISTFSQVILNPIVVTAPVIQAVVDERVDLTFVATRTSGAHRFVLVFFYDQSVFKITGCEQTMGIVRTCEKRAGGTMVVAVNNITSTSNEVLPIVRLKAKALSSGHSTIDLWGGVFYNEDGVMSTVVIDGSVDVQ